MRSTFDVVGVTAADGPLDAERVPVAAEPTARQDGDPELRYDDDVPLVGVNQPAGVAMVGAPLIDESYESEEGFGVDAAGYGNFPFLTNLIDRLSDRETGPVLVDGWHTGSSTPPTRCRPRTPRTTSATKASTSASRASTGSPTASARRCWTTRGRSSSRRRPRRSPTPRSTRSTRSSPTAA